jgi:hypothetical protein
MLALRSFTIFFAILLAASEIARWSGRAEFIPLALDEVLVALAMIMGALAAHRIGAAGMVAGWGAFCGLMLGLLMPTLNHLIHGPAKESAVFYAAGLGVMICVGLVGVAWSISHCRRAGPPSA